MTLIESLKTVPDFSNIAPRSANASALRYKYGRFHELWFLLLLLIVAAGSGYWATEDTATGCRVQPTLRSTSLPVP